MEDSEFRLRNKHRTIKDKKTFHISWKIAWLSVGILLGTLGSLYLHWFTGIEWLLIAGFLLVVSLRKKSYGSIVFALVAGCLLGLWRGSQLIRAESGYKNYYNQIVSASGQVTEDPTYDIDGDLRFKLQDVWVEGQAIGGELWIATTQNASIKRSDRVEISGRLTEGFGTIPAAIFRARIIQVDRQDYADVGRDTRDWFAEGIRESIQEPEASLGSGFLLGQKTALPEKLDQELRLLGLTHIVVASGYNLTILVRFARKLFAKISRFTALLASSVFVYGFLQITGNSPSMARASLIAGISLLAWYFGRKLHPLVLLPFSAAVTVLINPSYAWGDIGWLLSFTSFIGVIILSPLIHAYFWGESKPNNIRQVFIETLSAQVLTLPIIAYVFEQYSPLALVANLLILPLIPFAMLLILFAGFSGVLATGLLPAIVGWPAEVVLRYMTMVVDRLAELPLASAEIQVPFWLVIMMYVGLVGLMIYLKRKTGYALRSFNVIE